MLIYELGRPYMSSYMHRAASSPLPRVGRHVAPDLDVHLVASSCGTPHCDGDETVGWTKNESLSRHAPLAADNLRFGADAAVIRLPPKRQCSIGRGCDLQGGDKGRFLSCLRSVWEWKKGLGQHRDAVNVRDLIAFAHQSSDFLAVAIRQARHLHQRG